MLRLLLLFCLFSGGLRAQSPDSTAAISRFQVGVVYGQMDHEVEFTPSRDVEALRGREIGVAVRYFDKRLVGIQAELSLVDAGWREDLGDTLTSQYERSFQFAELQLLTQFSFGDGVFQPMLQAGPYLSVPLSEAETIPAGFSPDTTGVPVVYGFDLPFRINYGLRVGLGFNVELGPLTLQADARALIGFNDLIKTGTTRAAISRRTGLGGHAGLFYAF